MTKPIKFIVSCASWNGLKDVLFLMRSDDFRLADQKFGYTVIGSAKHDGKNKTAIANGVVYKVFSDWSVKAIA